ncbi:hypothetical protein ACFWY5_29600 [Nonomuraea sp. NPDC059007]|uniref:hypothetical protein n=1 Tax=Nonomuraea sp. NPDC059007 TaxID=3346692 RepID=UPI0036C655EA
MTDPAIRKRNRANKRKGYGWEFEVCKYFNAVGYSWQRNGQRHGGADQGDIDTGLPLIAQCKDVERLSIWKTADDAEQQAENADELEWVIFLKRRKATPGEGLAVVPMWLYREMLVKFHGHPDPADS